MASAEALQTVKPSKLLWSARNKTFLWKIRQTLKMSHIPQSFLFVMLLAAGAAVAQDGAPSPQILLGSAIRALESCDSVSAKLRHETHLFGKDLLGTGIYKEQRPGRDYLMRVELKFPVGDDSCSLVQVCDGRYLWEYRNFPTESKVARTDIVRVIRAMEQADRVPKDPHQPILPGIGGLTKVLRGLADNFEFQTVEPGKWGSQKQLVWRMRGTWNRANWLRLLPDQKAQIEGQQPLNLAKLPEIIPDEIVLLLGQEDLFPYRIEYRRTQPAKDDESKPSATSLVVVDFTDVSINVEIPRQTFYYSPGDIKLSEETDNYILSLGLKP